ncbi:hypothetical protein ACINNAV83_2796 [Acinetobacter baumannii Naval-83]|nr:hypothetical protein ACINNAV83_2796 [Acinetobacter baumannii Naval-83]KZA13020.1 hypothetical protein LV36_02127 [Acinetobacter baumannii]
MCLESFNEKWEAWANAWQSQQAKVEELQKQLSEYIFVSETLDEMYVKEVQKSDELQKRVDAVIIEIENMYLSGAIGFDTVKKLEQALKGEGQ